MNGRPVSQTAAHLTDNGTGSGEEQLDLEAYQRQLVATAKLNGQDRARTGDTDAFDNVVEQVRELAATRHEFDADDVEAFDRRGVVGAAFAHLRRSGEIVVAGYGISRRPQRHGALTRRWRGAP